MCVEKSEETVYPSYEEKVQMLLGYYREVVHYVSTIGVRCDDIDDIAQDTFIEALSGLDKLRDVNRMKYWLLKISKRKAYKYMRKNSLKNLHEYSFDADKTRRLIDSGVESDRQLDHMLDRISSEKLWDIIMALNEKERKVLLLHYIYGYKHREIALIIGESDSNVRTLARRAKEHLRQHIEKEIRESWYSPHSY